MAMMARCAMMALVIVSMLVVILCPGRTLGQSSTPRPAPVPQEWYKEEIPNPQVDVDKCGREGRRSWVCDPNRILTFQDGKQL